MSWCNLTVDDDVSCLPGLSFLSESVRNYGGLLYYRSCRPNCSGPCLALCCYMTVTLSPSFSFTPMFTYSKLYTILFQNGAGYITGIWDTHNTKTPCFLCTDVRMSVTNPCDVGYHSSTLFLVVHNLAVCLQNTCTSKYTIVFTSIHKCWHNYQSLTDYFDWA